MTSRLRGWPSRRLRLLLVPALPVACALLAACDALLTDPATGGTEIALQFQVEEAPLGGTDAAFSRVRRVGLRLVRPDSQFRDTVLSVVPTDGRVRVSLTIESEERILGLGITARLGTATADLFRGGTVVGIVPGEPVQAEVPLLPVPARVEADPDTFVFASILDTLALSSTVLYATGDTVRGLLGPWSSADPSIVAVTPLGIAVAISPGTTVLETRLDTLFDSVVVEVPPPPVPEIVSWLNPLGGNWSDGASWSRGAPPIPGDTVEITLAGTYTVVQDVAAPPLGGLTLGNATGTQTLVTAAAPLNVPDGVTITGGGALDVGAGGSLATVSPLSVPAGTSLRLGDNATVTAPSITVAPGATLDFGNLVTVTAAVSADGLLNVGGGRVTINGVLTTSATTTIRIGLDGTVSRLVVPAGFTNNGLIQQSGGGQVDVGASTLLNPAGGTIAVVTGPSGGDSEIIGTLNNLGTLTMDVNLRLSSAGATHTNAGSLTTTSAAWLLVIDADGFTNSGTIDADGGVLSLRFTGAGTGFINTGAVSVQNGTFVEVFDGPFTQPTGSISGNGTLRLIDVTATLPAAVALGTELPDFFQLETSSLTVPLLTIPTGSQLQLQDGSLTGDVNVQGWLAAFGAGTSVVSGVLTTAAGSVVSVEGGSLGNPTLSIPAGYTNLGSTRFQSSQAGSSATLQTSVLTNGIGGSVAAFGPETGTYTIVGNVQNQSGFTLQQDLTIQGSLSDQGTFSTTYSGNGSALNLQGLDIWNASFDNVRVVSTGGTLTNFNAVTFSNMDPAAVQLSITHPGSGLGALTMTGLNFATTPTTGSYMSLTDSDGGPTFLTVIVLSSTPLTGSLLSLLTGGALLTW